MSDKICFLKKVLDKKELNSMRNQMKDHRISCVIICSTSEHTENPVVGKAVARFIQVHDMHSASG